MQIKLDNVSKLYNLVYKSYFEISVFEISRVDCIGTNYCNFSSI